MGTGLAGSQPAKLSPARLAAATMAGNSLGEENSSGDRVHLWFDEKRLGNVDRKQLLIQLFSSQ